MALVLGVGRELENTDNLTSIGCGSDPSHSLSPSREWWEAGRPPCLLHIPEEKYGLIQLASHDTLGPQLSRVFCGQTVTCYPEGTETTMSRMKHRET